MNRPIFNFFTKLQQIFIKKTVPKPLGRWNHQNHNLKADYANMDSCGDILCGKPDHFKTVSKLNKK